MDVISDNTEDAHSVIERAVQAIKAGKVVAAPTDTVYGLLADATNAQAVQRVFQIKQRAPQNAVPVFVRDIAMAHEYAVIEEKQEPILRSYWPGKVTFVLASKGTLPKELGTEQTIGLRIPGHELIQSLLEQTGVPLTGTSANLSGAGSLLSGEEVIAQFSDQPLQPDVVVDIGKLPPSDPSRVIDITGSEPRILRE